MTGTVAGHTQPGGGRRGGQWRIGVWGTAAVLLVLPLLVMLFNAEMTWDGADFVVWGAMLAIAAGIYELGARLSTNVSYRLAMGIAAVAGFLIVWINLAVGFIGNEDNPANLMYVGIFAIGAVGALLARFRARGMSRALLAMAVAQALVGVIAMAAALDTRLFVLLANGFFVAVWTVSAALFRNAAREQVTP